MAIGSRVMPQGHDNPQGWLASHPILCPGHPGSFDEVSVKDPSIVYHGNLWHVYYTAVDRIGAVSLGYVSAGTLDGLENAPRVRVPTDGYAAAPQLFFFEPRNAWYLIYQTLESNYQPVFSTSQTPGDPMSWTSSRHLVEKTEPGKWIDFWVICDAEKACLFFTRQEGNGDLMMMQASLGDFPKGFSAPVCLLSDLHEAVHVYKAKGETPEFHLFYEERNGGFREFGRATSRNLEGPWERQNTRWITRECLCFPGGVSPWTNNISHGELLRSGCNQFLEADVTNPTLLIQGNLNSEAGGEYRMRPWRLGLLHPHTNS